MLKSRTSRNYVFRLNALIVVAVKKFASPCSERDPSENSGIFVLFFAAAAGRCHLFALENVHGFGEGQTRGDCLQKEK